MNEKLFDLSQRPAVEKTESIWVGRAKFETGRFIMQIKLDSRINNYLKDNSVSFAVIPKRVKDQFDYTHSIAIEQRNLKSPMINSSAKSIIDEVVNEGTTKSPRFIFSVPMDVLQFLAYDYKHYGQFVKLLAINQSSTSAIIRYVKAGHALEKTYQAPVQQSSTSADDEFYSHMFK